MAVLVAFRINPERSSSNEKRKQFYHWKINDILDFKNKKKLYNFNKYLWVNFSLNTQFTTCEVCACVYGV